MSSKRIAAALFSGVMCLFCVAVGLNFLVGGLYAPIRSLLSAETTTGTVLSRRVEDVSGKEYTARPVVKYKYTYEGHTYTNDKITPRYTDKMESRFDAEEVIAQYPPGKQVTVYILPEDPGASFLSRTWPRIFTLSLAAGFLVFGVLLGIGCVKIITGEAHIGRGDFDSGEFVRAELSDDRRGSDYVQEKYSEMEDDES